MIGNLRVYFVAGALALAAGTGFAAGAADSGPVAAIVNGKAITEAEVRAANADQLKGMEVEYLQRRHDAVEGKLDEMVNDMLVEAEASARGVSKEAVLALIKGAAVTDADIDKFYEENKTQIPRPKEQVLPQIRQYLEQAAQGTAKTDFFKDLRNKYKVEIKLDPFRVPVAATGPAWGPATAPVTIVEFTDFQCLFCERAKPSLETVKAKYGDKVRIVFRQFPLSIHPNAAKAAEASLCADEQKKYSEMRDVMFKDQKSLGIDALKKSAATLGLNAEEFGKCLDSGKHGAVVQRDMSDGVAAGVSGTPAIFINGRLISGAVPIDQITTVIDDELRRSGAVKPNVP